MTAKQLYKLNRKIEFWLSGFMNTIYLIRDKLPLQTDIEKEQLREMNRRLWQMKIDLRNMITDRFGKAFFLEGRKLK